MIKGIIFDLGSTLLQFTKDWDLVIQEGAAAMATWYLKKRHIKLNSEALIHTFIAEQSAGRDVATRTQNEVLAQQTLQETLNKIDAPASANPHIEAALKIYFASEEEAWQPFPGAVDMLKSLKKQNYRLGLYSNATDDLYVQRLINRNGFRPWLSPTFSSAGWGWRKPKPEPFGLIAQRWDLSPQEIVVVGDTLQADILGAQNAGMCSILAKMNEAPSNNDNQHIQPTATIQSLAQLPEIINQL